MPERLHDQMRWRSSVEGMRRMSMTQPVGTDRRGKAGPRGGRLDDPQDAHARQMPAAGS
jgi:hypothetical protein